MFKSLKRLSYILVFLLVLACANRTYTVMISNINKYVAIILVTIEVYMLLFVLYNNVENYFLHYELIEMVQNRYNDTIKNYILLCNDHKKRYQQYFLDNDKDKIRMMSINIMTRGSKLIIDCDEIYSTNLFLDKHQKRNVLDMKKNIFQMLNSESYSLYDLSYENISFSSKL